MARHSTTLAARPASLATTPISPAVGSSATRAARPTSLAVGSSAAVSRATLRRRRLIAVVALLVLSTLLTVAIGRVGAEAELADPVAGHVVVAPGDTLWDVAVESAPDGVDPREQLTAIQGLNGLDSSAVDPWTVLLLPAR
jgi:hypothetical protein